MLRFTVLLGLVIFVRAVFAEDIPWPEHPRPDLMRSNWVNLNGAWQFAFDPEDEGLKGQWFVPGKHTFERRIIVPFPWESKLSGIGDTEYRGVAWYAKEVTLPAGPGWISDLDTTILGQQTWLVIGACDFECTVWVNGREAVRHTGGYLPVEVNLSPFGKPGERVTIIVRAVDTTDEHQPVGKQHGWYTRTSGIWQTVYLESRGGTYIRSLRGRADIQEGSMRFTVGLSRPAIESAITISSPEGAFETVRASVDKTDKVELTVKIDQPELWSPDSPKLYAAVVKFHAASDTGGPPVEIDAVSTYFGLREISVGEAPGRDYQYVFLNGRPVYLRGALHQSFHPAGIYQYPDDTTMRGDYELCKRIGINMLRIHIKTPIPRELYWADRLGVLIMQDMPNFWKHSEQARSWWRENLEGAVARDFNHPSIFAWVNFNETWGINDGGYGADRHAWVKEMYELTKSLDPTRLVEDNSPCHYDHVVTDLNTWHFYINDYAEARRHVATVVEKTRVDSEFNFVRGYRQGNQPLMNSEYGGISAGAGDQDVSWSFKFLTNELRLHDRICGYVYTELSDIEWEHNGFVNYDRSPKEFGYEFWHPGLSLSDLNSADFVAIDSPPVIELRVDEEHEVPIRISHWSDRKIELPLIRWQISRYDRFGEYAETDWMYLVDVEAKPFRTVTQPTGPRLVLRAESGLRAGALRVELLDDEQVLARNYVNLLAIVPASPRVEAVDARTLALRFLPGEYTAWSFAGDRPERDGLAAHKVAGAGAGAVEYEVRLPAGLPIEEMESLVVVAELASHAGDAKLDWPARRKKDKKQDYPQTDTKKWPSDVVLSINGRQVASRTLPDDPADARGMLSHHRGYQGAYGFLAEEIVDGEELQAIVDALGVDRKLRIRWEVPGNARHVGGLTIYGEQLGRYPVDPTLLVTFKREHGMPQSRPASQPSSNPASAAGH